MVEPKIVKMFVDLAVPMVGFESALGRVLLGGSVGLVRVYSREGADLLVTDRKRGYHPDGVAPWQHCIIANHRWPRTDYADIPNIHRIRGLGDEFAQMVEQLFGQQTA